MKHFSFKHCHHHSTASLNRKRQALQSKVAQNSGISGASNLERPCFKTIFLGMLCSTSPAEEASPYPIVIKHMCGAKGRHIVGQSRQSREQRQEDLRICACLTRLGTPGARSIQPKFPEISIQNSMDRFGPTGKVSKKQVHLLRWSSFPGRTGLTVS